MFAMHRHVELYEFAMISGIRPLFHDSSAQHHLHIFDLLYGDSHKLDHLYNSPALSGPSRESWHPNGQVKGLVHELHLSLPHDGHVNLSKNCAVDLQTVIGTGWTRTAVVTPRRERQPSH